MPLEFGSLFNAASNIQSSLGKEQSIKSFLNAVNSMGVLIKSFYEVNFDGIPQMSFFCKSVSVPRMKTNSLEFSFAHQEVSLPVNMEYGHESSITLLSDGGGYFYSALTNFLLDENGMNYSAKGHTITIKSISGDNEHYNGMTITMNGVRINDIGNLTFSTEDNNILEFELDLYVRNFTVTPGIASKIAGITGALGGLLG